MNDLTTQVTIDTRLSRLSSRVTPRVRLSEHRR